MRKPKTVTASRLLQGLVLVVLALGAAPAWGYNVFSLDGGRSIVRWTSLPVDYEVNRTFVPYMNDDVTIIQDSFDVWSGPTCTNFSSRFSGVTNATSTSVVEGTTDGSQRVVYTPASSWPVSLNNALAVTQSSYRFSRNTWTVNEADIAFNGGVSWSSSPGRNEYDLQGVATHEIGHLIGLQHSPNTDATMYFSTPPANTSVRALTDDDAKGSCFLYPAGGQYTCQNARFDCPEVEGRDDRGRDVSYGRMGCDNGECAFGGDVGQGLGQGEVCTNFQDCDDDLICVTIGDEAICTAECSTRGADTCPDGYFCVALQGAVDGGGACVPGGDGTADYGEPCDDSGDCASELCVGSEDGAICTQFCSLTRQDCPRGSICVGLRGGDPDTGACIFEGDDPPGTVCDSVADCPGGLCLQGADRVFRCRQPCDFGVNADCAPGTACLPIDQGGACFESGDGQLGELCAEEGDCASLLCLEHPETDERVCSVFCDGACPSGFECVELSANFAGCFEPGGPATGNNNPGNNSPGNNNPGNNNPGGGGFVDGNNDNGSAGGGNGGFVGGGNGFVGGEEPRQGCHVAPAQSSMLSPVWWLALVACVLWRRRRGQA